MRADLLVVGGGPAGLATAICAAQEGLRPVVVDARRLPLDKACGEGILPAGVEALHEMGVALRAGARQVFRGIRYVEGDLAAEGRFRGGPGWGVRRTALVEGLVGRARDLGVELHYGCRVTAWRRDDRGVVAATARGPVEAGLLVGADGLHSRIRAEAGLAGPRRGGRERLGVRRHYAVVPWSDCVEVHLAGDVEAYVTPVARREVGVALLWSGGARREGELLARLPALRDRLAGACPTSAPRGAGPFRQVVRRRHAPRVALVGDAAGALDPITGEGITLSLLAARALARTLARGAPLGAYERAYRRIVRTPSRMTSLLLAIAPRRRLRRRVIATLARCPELFDHLLAVNDGRASLHGLGVGGLARLAAGLAAPPAPGRAQSL